MKTFEITFGREVDKKGYVRAESHEAVRSELHGIGWPILSHIVEIPVMELGELAEQLDRLQKEKL